MFKRLIDLGLMIGAFGEDRGAVGGKVPLGMGEKGIEGGEGAGGQNVGLERRDGFDTGGKDLDGDTELSPRSREERSLALIAFHEDHREMRLFGGGEDRDDHSGKATAAAKIGPMPCCRGSEVEYLCRIKQVPAPKIIERRPCDEIDRGIPLADQRFEPGQPLRCFP